MAQSIYQSYQHFITGTKNRYPFIKPEIKTELHKYISGVLRKLVSPCLCINSMPDHIHILFRQSKIKNAADIIYSAKSASSRWIKTHKGIKKFKWQVGYACFSVNPDDINVVKQYIEKQNEHHNKITFKEEIEQFMKDYGIEDYDPEYFWS